MEETEGRKETLPLPFNSQRHGPNITQSLHTENLCHKVVDGENGHRIGVAAKAASEKSRKTSQKERVREDKPTLPSYDSSAASLPSSAPKADGNTRESF